MMTICCSVLVPLLLAVGAAGSRQTLAVNDTQLAAEVIRNVGKMFDDPNGGPSLLFQQFIAALQQYTEQVVNDAVNRALPKLAPFIGLDDMEDPDKFPSESSRVDPPPMLSLDHQLQFLDRQRNVALQNYIEALDNYRDIQPKILQAEDLDDQAWLENENAKLEFYEIRDHYLKKGVTNPLDKEDYKKTLLKWNLTHKQQLKALESLLDVRNAYMDSREQYMHAKEQHTLAQQRYMETVERYPTIRDHYPQIYERYPQQEVTSVEREQAAEQSSRKKSVTSSKKIDPTLFPELSQLDKEKDNLPRHIKHPSNSDKVSIPMPPSPAALHSNVEWLGTVKDEHIRVAIEANTLPNIKESSGILKSRRRRSSGWDILSSLNPLNANFSSINNILSGDSSILNSLFEDSPQVIYCPSTGTKLIRCVRDQLFHRVVKTQIDSLGSWFSNFVVPDFYL